MFFIIGHLDFPTTSRLINGSLHRLGNRVRIHNDMPFTVTSGTSNGLDESTLVTKETFLVSIENGNQAYLRNINSFTEQVDSDQDIKKEIRDLIAVTKVVAKEEDKEIDINSLNKQERKELVKKLEKQMQEAVEVLDFELAAQIRDMMLEVKALD